MFFLQKCNYFTIVISDSFSDYREILSYCTVDFYLFQEPKCTGSLTGDPAFKYKVPLGSFNQVVKKLKFFSFYYPVLLSEKLKTVKDVYKSHVGPLQFYYSCDYSARKTMDLKSQTNSIFPRPPYFPQCTSESSRSPVSSDDCRILSQVRQQFSWPVTGTMHSRSNFATVPFLSWWPWKL